MPRDMESQNSSERRHDSACSDDEVIETSHEIRKNDLYEANDEINGR